MRPSDYKLLIDTLVKEAVGFANTAGGVILVGWKMMERLPDALILIRRTL